MFLQEIKLAYRFYSFVAHHYLSPLQCGLQTAHAVSEMSCHNSERYTSWAEIDKTIVICGAGNQAGVVQAWEGFRNFRDYHNIPIDLTLFREDRESMNQMITACGIIVSDYFYDAYLADTGILGVKEYVPNVEGIDSAMYTPSELEFVKYLKSFRLA